MRRMLRMNLFLGIPVLFILTTAGLVFLSDELPFIKGVLSLKESIRIVLKNSTLIQERKKAILQAMGDTPEINGNNLTNKKMGSIILQARWTFFEWGKTKSEVRKAESQKLVSVSPSMTQA